MYNHSYIKDKNMSDTEKKPSGYWKVYNHCYDAAKLCKTKSEFQKRFHGAFNSAVKNGWIKDYTWFVCDRHKPLKWTKELILQEAKKYTTLADFRTKSKGAYNASRYYKMLDSFDWLKRGKNVFTDECYTIYRYYFRDLNTVYIGITIKPKRRNYEHHNGGPVFNFSKENNIEIPEMEILKTGLKQEEATYEEGTLVSEYKNMQFNVLNKGKTGLHSSSIGACANHKWAKYTVFEESKKYTTIKDFRKNCRAAHEKAYKENWLPEMTWLKKTRRENGYWTKERYMEEARKYKTSVDFYNNSGSAYQVGWRNGWFKEIDFFEKPTNKNKFTKEQVFELAKQCNTKTEFYNKSKRAFERVRDENWFIEMPWLIETRKPRNYWKNKDNCCCAANECETRWQFKEKYYQGYEESRKNGWLDEFFPKVAA